MNRQRSGSRRLALPMHSLTSSFNPVEDWRVNFFRVEGVDGAAVLFFMAADQHAAAKFPCPRSIRDIAFPEGLNGVSRQHRSGYRAGRGEFSYVLPAFFIILVFVMRVPFSRQVVSAGLSCHSSAHASAATAALGRKPLATRRTGSHKSRTAELVGRTDAGFDGAAFRTWPAGQRRWPAICPK